MSGQTSGKQKQQSAAPHEMRARENLITSVTVVPDGSTIFRGRVVWDNDTPAKCTTCRFIGKVADFEPAESYSPENEAEWEEKIVLY